MEPDKNTLNFEDLGRQPVGEDAAPKPTQAREQADALLQPELQPAQTPEEPTAALAPATSPVVSTASQPAAVKAIPVFQHPATAPSSSPATVEPAQTQPVTPAASVAAADSPIAATPFVSHPESGALASVPAHASAAETLELPSRPTTATTAPPPSVASATAIADNTEAVVPVSRWQASYSLVGELLQKSHLNRIFSKTVLKYIFIGIVSVGIFFLVFNFPVIMADLHYHFSKTQPAPAITASQNSATVGATPEVIIPKINVTAPIQFPPTLDENQIEVALRDGVVHYANTSLPGQGGNTVLFGHSSNDWWQPGNFKFIFALLDRLSAGDTIQVNYQGVRYVYQVTGSKVVEPTDFSVVQPTTTPTLSLITCTPPGTSWKRLVVTATQIEPAPSQKAASSPNPTVSQPATLPSDAPNSIWTKFTNGLKKIF